MMENQGDWVTSDVTFTCSNNGCTGTVGTQSVTLDFKGTKPTDGTVTLSTTGEAKITKALVINGFKCSSQTDKSVKCEVNS